MKYKEAIELADQPKFPNKAFNRIEAEREWPLASKAWAAKERLRAHLGPVVAAVTSKIPQNDVRKMSGPDYEAIIDTVDIPEENLPKVLELIEICQFRVFEACEDLPYLNANTETAA